MYILTFVVYFKKINKLLILVITVYVSKPIGQNVSILYIAIEQQCHDFVAQ